MANRKDSTVPHSIEIPAKERPILFSGPMVRAILDGRKTQTRRIVKKAYDTVAQEHPFAICPANVEGWIAWYGVPRPDIAEFTKWAYTHGFPCPYGKPGDRLWVRETWAPHDERALYNAKLDGDLSHIYYRADNPKVYDSDGPWRPSIFMPRWASRITLEITEVRCERLQGITEEDAIAEGVVKVRDACHVIRGFDYDLAGLCHTEAVTPFAKLWDEINGKSHPWDSDPWVWVVSFRRVEA